jgi:putative protease
MAEKIGKITHYFGKIGVGVIELSGDLNVGDQITIKRGDGEFEQTVGSMQVEHQEVAAAKAGDAVGLKVDQPVKEGDEVYKDIEKMVFDNLPKIDQGPVIDTEKLNILKQTLDSYQGKYQKNLPLLISKKGSTGEFLLGNEQVMQRAFASADNLRRLQSSLNGAP